MPAIHPFPQPEASDPDSVADALDSGLLHWVKGEIPEALQCLRAAGAASADAGSEQRALDLVRMADELTSKQETAAPAIAAPATAAPASEAPAGSHTVTVEEPKPQSTLGRSKLPEPPSGPKKFTGSPESDAAMVASRVASSGSHTSTASKNSTAEKSSIEGKPLSGPSAHPPSARPPALGGPSSSLASKSAGANGSAGISSIKPLSSAAAPIADVSTQRSDPEGSVATSLNPTASPLTDGSTENSAASPPRKSFGAGATRSTSYSPTVARSTNAPNASATPEARVSSRPHGIDHRLASVRVRIECVESDGTIRLRLLDLAATASGEDNALLIVNQNLWQELKRGG